MRPGFDATSLLPETAGLAPAGWLAVGSGVAFAALAFTVARHGVILTAFDEHVHAWAVAHRSAWNISLARGIASTAATEITLPALVLVGAIAPVGRLGVARRVGSGVLLSAIAGLGVSLEILVNRHLARPRPPLADWAGAAGGSAFPSGHTTSATLFAVSLAWALQHRARRRTAVLVLFGATAAYAVAVAWSRVWLGVHWTTDVVGAWLFGIAWMAAASAALHGLRQVGGPMPTGRAADGASGPVGEHAAGQQPGGWIGSVR
jgi:membrane-associated phospholipid phosphatase